MSGPDLASFQAGFLAGRAHTDRAGTPYTSDIAAAFTAWRATLPAPAPAVPVEPAATAHVEATYYKRSPDRWAFDVMDDLGVVCSVPAASGDDDDARQLAGRIAALLGDAAAPAGPAWAADGHALTWPDDENPDIPCRFYESHLAEAWPDALDRQVGAAFAALRAALAAPSPAPPEGLQRERFEPIAVIDPADFVTVRPGPGSTGTGGAATGITGDAWFDHLAAEQAEPK